MIIDSSALVAIVKGEWAATACVEAIYGADEPLISAANALEAAIVVDSVGSMPLSDRLDRIRDELGIAIAPVTAMHYDIARQAHRHYGKGSHPAKLNFGDCISYALAIEHGMPLLFVGHDFSKTDVEWVLNARSSGTHGGVSLTTERMQRPVRFTYLGFHDVPRAIVFQYDDRHFLLDSSFLEAMDEYSDTYEVVALPGSPPDGSWEDLASSGTSLGRIAVADMLFDGSARAAIDLAPLLAMLEPSGSN